MGRSKHDRELDAIIAREDLFRKLYRQLHPGLVAAYAAHYQTSPEVAGKCLFTAVLEPVLVDFHANTAAAEASIPERMREVQDHYRYVLDQCAAMDPEVAYNADHEEKFTFIMKTAIHLLRTESAA